MITSFFSRRPDGEAAGPATIGAPAKRPVDATKPAETPETHEGKIGGGRKRVRKDPLEDDEEEVAAAEVSVTPAPAPAALSQSPEAPAAMDVSDTPAATEASPAQTEASSSKDAAPAAEAKAAPAAKKASPAKAAASASKEAEEEEAEEEEEDDEGEDEDEDEDEDGAKPAKALSLKQAGKAPAKGKGAKVVGTTAAQIKYHAYDPIRGATWKPGEPVPYIFLARVFGTIEETSKRLIITERMANAFRSVIATSPKELLSLTCLATNKLAPAYMGIELGIGDSIMIKAVSETCGRSVAAIKDQLEVDGDLGVVTLSSRAKQVTLMKPKPLMVGAVLKTLKEIALISGNEAQKRKKDKIKNMLVASQEKEAQYIVRALQGKMRIGLAEQTVLVSLAHAVLLTPPPGTPEASQPVPKGEALQEALAEAESIVKQAFCEMPNYEVIIPALLEHGIHALPRYAALTAGIPVKPMLAKPTKGISEVLDRFSHGAFTCEYKYDGERAQIHMLPAKPPAEGVTVNVFSRNSEDNSTKYPDIAAIVPRAAKPGVSSFILDSEAVAIDKTTGAIQPFQVLSTRKRKEADLDDIKVKVCVFAFDLLYLNGESLLQKPLLERRRLLRESFEVIPHEFDFAQSSDAADVEAIQEFLTESIKGNCEGLMVKTLEVDATYEPSKRSLNWLKVKKDYLAGMTDSCDLVPIGAYYGKGKRTGVYGAYLLACYNDEEESYESVCKIGTGFSDANLEKLHKELSERTIEAPRAYYRVPEWADGAMPDVWFEPCQVWEVLAADLSISPVHMAAVGRVDPSRGIALRFPRFLHVREDKGCEDATNSTQIADMYNNQATTKDTKGGGADDDDY